MEAEAKPFTSLEETVRQRQRELLVFQRDVVLPLREAAAAKIAAARPPLFNLEWLAPKWGQRLADAMIAVGTAAAAMDEGHVRAAVEAWVQTNLEAFGEFEAALERRKCPTCGATWDCGHDTLQPGQGAEFLYPARPRRLQRPLDTD